MSKHSEPNSHVFRIVQCVLDLFRPHPTSLELSPTRTRSPSVSMNMETSFLRVCGGWLACENERSGRRERCHILVTAQIRGRASNDRSLGGTSPVSLQNHVLCVPGGGTVCWVQPQNHKYLQAVEHREEDGTPASVESIRTGLVFRLHH